MSTPRRGRPKKCDASVVSETITFKLTKAEADRILAAARAERMGISEYMRVRIKELSFPSR